MINHLAPPYLSLLFGTNYSYVNSFLPNAVKEWNKLPITIRQNTKTNRFKSKLSKLECPTKPPVYYNAGSRQGQIHHARLRYANQ